MTIAEELRTTDVTVADADLACAALRWSMRCRWEEMRHDVGLLSEAAAREVALAAAIVTGAAAARAGIPVAEVLPGGAP